MSKRRNGEKRYFAGFKFNGSGYHRNGSGKATLLDKDGHVIQPPGGDFREKYGRDNPADVDSYDDGKKGWNSDWKNRGDRRNGPVITIADKDKTDGVDVPSSWTTGETREKQCASACSFKSRGGSVAEKEVHIVLSTKVQDAIQFLREDSVANKLEWQMLLSGEVKEEDGVEYVNCLDFYIPKQEVGPAHVKNVDCIDKEFIETRKIIATIHSHVNMAVFLSMTDEEDCAANSQIKYHMVTNNRSEYTAVKAVDLPCGMKSLDKAKVYLSYRAKPEGFENIQEQVPRYTQYGA